MRAFLCPIISSFEKEYSLIFRDLKNQTDEN